MSVRGVSNLRTTTDRTVQRIGVPSAIPSAHSPAARGRKS